MEREGCVPMLWRFLRSSLLIGAGLSAGAAAVAFVFGARTAQEICNALGLAGFVSLLVGGMSLVGGASLAASPMYHFAGSAGGDSYSRRAQRILGEIFGRFRFFVIMAGATAVCFIIAGVIQLLST